jgi:hypothetical protein
LPGYPEMSGPVRLYRFSPYGRTRTAKTYGHLRANNHPPGTKRGRPASFDWCREWEDDEERRTTKEERYEERAKLHQTLKARFGEEDQ